MWFKYCVFVFFVMYSFFIGSLLLVFFVLMVRAFKKRNSQNKNLSVLLKMKAD